MNESEDLKNVKLVFEIGVHRGAGVRSFKDYFPNALIVGIDIDPSVKFVEERISIEIGNVSDRDFLSSLITKYGKPDIVIDDGTYNNTNIFNTFDSSTKLCNIEDL